MARIFISYSRKNEDFARHLASDLDALGADVWIDVDDIPAGMKWSTAIQQGLNMCEVMIVIISPDSMGSRNVEDEWQAYLDDRKPILPVLWQPARVHFQLRRIQYVDFHTQAYDTAFAQLHSELRRNGIQLAPLSATDPSIQLPLQKPLPTQGEGFPRAYIVLGVVIALIVIVTLALAVSGLLDGGDPSASSTPETQIAQNDTSTPTDMPPPEPTNSPAETPTATIPPDQEVWLEYTQTADAFTDTPTPTPTSTLTYTPTLDATATKEYWQTVVAQTLTQAWIESWTDTPTPTLTPTPTPTLTPTLSPLQLAETFNGSNNDWEPFVQKFDGVEMVLVPAGCFMMGSETGDDDEKPVNEVCFDEPFWIDRYEVSNAQFATFNGQAANDSAFSGDDRPRENITWFEARDFCESRGARLPTEAEWEYAARGPDALEYPWGNEFDWGKVVGNRSSSEGTAPVGSLSTGTSWVDAYDMSGNMWEWVNTIYEDYPYTVDDGRESNDNTNISRVLRGGSWINSYSNFFRAAYRNGGNPQYWLSSLGFRCVRPY
ncbi:MAG: SUMF1/EgtB/PvdO family nonheme iron enzyme [Anaerolineae bacterium]|nr:SUMF1/EgtB/PvdO family nonheme iron enzyme [Anaerolineae bacterium]